MNSKWALQDARNRFSELVDTAVREGPQTITRRGKDTAVLLSVDQFRKLTQRGNSLVDFLRDSPLKGVPLDLSRSEDTGREVSL
jgi:prevent-host-death family protein